MRPCSKCLPRVLAVGDANDASATPKSLDIALHRAVADVGVRVIWRCPHLNSKYNRRTSRVLRLGARFPGTVHLLSEVMLLVVLVSSAAMPLSTLDSCRSRSPFRHNPITDRLHAGMLIAFARNTA